MPFEPLTDNDVLEGVRELTAAGSIRWTDHAEDQMADRGVDKGQIKACLRKGFFTERPTIANRPGPVQYVFRMEASVDGVRIAVAAGLVPDKKVVVITVFEPREFRIS